MRVLNVGGGTKDIPLPPQYEGFQHVLLDISPGLGVDIVADVLEYNFKPVWDVVYCSHNLEHYYAYQTDFVLLQFKSALLAGGIVHIRVPNMGDLFRLIVEGGYDIDDDLYESPAGTIKVEDVIYGWGEEIARSGEPFYAHKTGFTVSKLERKLKAAGFNQVQVVAHKLELEAIGVKP